LIAATALVGTLQAQDADSTENVVVLPDDAQKCILPAAPDPIPDDATLDQLKVAKAQVGEFQAKVTEFRDCLAAAESNPDNTAGNSQAIVDSYNYSVEMEERVANRFNEAVRSYKERKAAAEG
jgi:hypothetical protein